MCVIKRLQQADHMCQARQDDHYVKDLMATTENIKRVWIRRLWKLTMCVSLSLCNVE